MLNNVQAQLAKLSQKNLWRSRKKIENYSGRYQVLENKKYHSFTSNDFLGLSQHPEIIASAQQALAEFGMNTCSSPLVSGYTDLHQELENQLAAFLGFESCIVCSSGYLANLAAIQSAIHRHDIIFMNKLVHASMVDACQLTHAKSFRYSSKDLSRLFELSEEFPFYDKWIVTEGIFSMDGKEESIKNILNENHHFFTIIDDAVGVGVLGKNGRGIIEKQNIKNQDIVFLTGTFAKAFGGYGGFIAGNKLHIEKIVQTGRSYIFNSALSPVHIAANLKSLEVLQQESWRRDKLYDLIKYFQKQADFYNIPFQYSESPIQILILKDNIKTLDCANYLAEKNILVSGIRPPSVPQNQARIRLCLNALHEESDIDLLFDALKAYLKNY